MGTQEVRDPTGAIRTPPSRLEPEISIALPCQVVVREAATDEVTVDFIDPAVRIDLVGDRIHDIAEEAKARFELVRDAVATASAIA